MNIKVYKDRQVLQLDNDVYGTQNENNVTVLKIEVPEQYANWNKRIVFLTEEGNKWDILGKDDTYVLQNNITKYEELEAYVWLTEKAKATEESVGDFRSEIFTLSFLANEDTDDIVPDMKQIDGFNSMLTVLNAEIAEVKQINTDFTKLKQEVEQAETERNNKVDEAVNKITDMTEEYNTNAKKKVEEYNDNAVKKEKTYKDLAEEKETELNNIADGVKDMATAIQFATFEVDNNMHLKINTADKLANTNFVYNEETGRLGVKIV